MYISAAETHYLCCNCVVFACPSRGTRDEFSAWNSWSFTSELLSGLKTSDDKKSHSRRVVRFAVAKELFFSTPLVGKWPLSASTGSQSHLGVSMIKPDLTQLGSEIKTGSAMER